MNGIEFPRYEDAPLELLQLEGNCGPVALWAVLKHFGKQVSSDKIIRACRHSKKNGTFAIVLATALQRLGLNTAFYTDPDPNPHYFERQAYGLAKKLGISINSALELESLMIQIKLGKLPIVLYDSPEFIGHFSPVLDIDDQKLILPLDPGKEIERQEFQNRWAAPEIYRQCIVVGELAS